MVVYSNLRLYSAICSTQTHWEGSFNISGTSDQSTQLYLNSLAEVEAAIKSGVFKINQGKSIISSEQDASKLIGHVKQRFPDSKGLVDLVDIYDYDIKFNRLLRVEGVAKANRQDLIRFMKESGIVPCETDSDVRHINEIMGRKPERIDELWDLALRFYST